MSRSATSKREVHFYVEDGFLVRGTLDPHEALALAVGNDDDFELRYWAAEEAMRCQDCTPDGKSCNSCDGDPPAETVAILGDLCHELIRTARPGLRRVVPAPRDCDDYRWFVHPADARGRGVFESVEFR